MAEIDSLEISIQSSVDKVNKSIDGLIGKLGLVSKEISAISTGKGLEGFSKQSESITSSIDKVSDSVKSASNQVDSAMNNIKKSMSGIDKPVEQVRKSMDDIVKEISGRTANITPEVNMENASNEIKKYENQLRSSQNALNRILASESADKQVKSIERLVIKINEAQNALKKLKAESEKSTDISIASEKPQNIVDDTEKMLSQYKSYLKEFDAEFEKTIGGGGVKIGTGAIEEMLSDLKKDIPSAIDLIESYEATIERVNNINKQSDFKPFDTGEWKEQTQNALSTVTESVTKVKSEVSEFEKTLANIHPLEFSGNFYEMEKWVNDLQISLENLYTKQERLNDLGVNPDSRGMKNLALNIEQISKTLDVYEQKLEEARAAGKLEIQIPSIDAPIDKIVSKTKILKDNLSDMKINISANSVQEVERQIEKVKQSYLNLVDKMGKAAAVTPFYGASADFKKKQIELSALRQRYQDLINKQKELSIAGADAISKIGEGNTENLNRSISITSDLAKQLGSVFSNLSKTIGKTFNNIARLARSGFSNLVKGIKGAVSGVGKLIKSFTNLNKESKKVNFSLSGGFKTILKYAFGIRSIFVLLNRIRSGFKDGMENLVQFSDSVNHSVSLMTSALGALKNSFAVAFAPIVNVVAPYIAKFVNMMTDAFNAVGRFFAALTGKKITAQATKYYKDYAESLNGVSSAAKDASKALHTLGIDELNIVNENKEAGADGGGVGIEDMFTNVPIEGAISDWAKRIRDAFLNGEWEELGKALAELVNAGLRKVYDAIKEITPKVEQALKNFAKVFNAFVEYLDWDLLGRTIGAGINLITKSINALLGDEGIDFENLGRKLSVGFRGLVDEVDWRELGNAFGNAFMVSWRILDGFIEDMSRKSNLGLTGWAELGNALGTAVNGLFERINFEKIARVLTEGFAGIVEAITYFVDKIDFTEIVSKINSGLDVLYNGIKWDNIGSKLTDFAKSISTKFNEIVNAFDWDKLGNVIGAGINIITKTFRTLTERIDFVELGRKISDAFMGIVDEVDWESFGNSFAKMFLWKFTILPELLYGFASRLDFSKTGTALGKALNGAVEAINIEAIGGLLGKAITGIFELAITFSETFDWKKLGNSIANGINELFKNMDANTVVEGCIALIGGLIDALIETVEKTDWKEVVDFIVDVMFDPRWWSLTNKLLELAWDLVKGLADGLWQKIKEITWSDIWNWILESFKNLFGIHSPSTVMYEQGGFLMQGLINGIEAFKDGVSEIWNLLKEATINIWTDIGKTLSNLWNGINEKAKSIFQNIKNTVSEIWDGVREKASETWGNVTSYLLEKWESIKTSASEKFSDIKETISEVWSNINEKIRNVWNEATTYLQEKWGFIKTTATEKFSSVRESVLEAWKTVREKTHETWQNITDSLGKTLESLKTSAKDKFDFIEEKIRDTWEKAKKKTENTWDGVKKYLGEKIPQIANGIKEKFSELPTFMTDNGRNIINGLMNGISEKVGALKNKIVEVAGNVSSWFKEKLGIHSPSTVFADIAGYTFQGFINGSDEKENAVMKTVVGIADSIISAFNSVRSDFVKIGSEMAISLGHGIVSRADVIKQQMKELAYVMIETFSDIPSRFKYIGTEIIRGLINEMGVLMEKIREIVSSIRDMFSNVFSGVSTFDNIGNVFGTIGSEMVKRLNKGATSQIGIIVESMHYIAQIMKSSFDAMPNEFKQIGSNMMYNLKSGLLSGIDSIKLLFRNFTSSIRDMFSNVFSGVSFNMPNLSGYSYSIPTFSTGGFPEDGLFFANHSELVGQFSNGRTAVANNEQIIAGIEEAAYRGFLRAQAETSPYLQEIADNTKRTADKDMSVKIGNRDIYDAYKSAESRVGWHF